MPKISRRAFKFFSIFYIMKDASNEKLNFKEILRHDA